MIHRSPVYVIGVHSLLHSLFDLHFFFLHTHRRMFPALKVELFDLDPNTTYTLYMDMVPVDKYRYKYQNSTWVRCFEEECSPTRLYMHPDSPALGSHWMNMVINFYKLKLTNNQLDKQGHVSHFLYKVGELFGNTYISSVIPHLLVFSIAAR